MRRSAWIRILAIVLVISMLAAPVSAAGLGGSNRTNGWGVGDLIGLIRDVIREIIGVLIPTPGDPQPTEPIETTEPTQPTEPVETTEPTEPVETEPEETQPEETQPEVTEPEVTEPEETEPEETEPEEKPETVLNLVEGYTNTENGYLLRGATYTLSTLVAQEEQSVTAPYALRNRSMSTLSLNNAVALAAETAVETAAATVSGTALVITTDDLGVVIPDGDYAMYCSTNGKYMTNTIGYADVWNCNTLSGTTSTDSATAWTFTRQADGSYTVQDPDGNYLRVTGHNTADLSTDPVYTNISMDNDNIILKTMEAANEYCYLNALGASTAYNFFGGWTAGSPITLYAVTSDDTETPVESKVVYFPVTMYNYDGATINASTDALDTNGTTIREGFYFSNGGTELGSVTYKTIDDTSAFVAGQYYIQNIRAANNGAGSWLYSVAEDTSIRGTADQSSATLWTLVVEDGEFYLMSGGKYLVVGTDGDSDGLTDTKTPVTLTSFSSNSDGVQIGQNGYYLCHWDGGTSIYYGGYSVNNDGGNGMKFFRVTDGVVSDTPTTISSVTTDELASGYERWNWWGYLSNGHTSQNKFYTGLVKNTLLDDQIVFNVLEGGVFNEDNQVKDIYEFVGLPFVLDTETGVYSFNSDDNGVYFNDTDGDGDTDPFSGTREEPNNLCFDRGNTQGWSGMNYGDGSTNLWAPYNTNANDTGEGAIDYHFGMRADLPFSMTPNGRIKSTDDESTPITFSFQGDDDVWIFIDGHLVIDLGGIHNRLGATVDFAANTITYFLPDSNNKEDLAIGSHNTPEEYPLDDNGTTITKKLFTDADGEGAIKMSRDAFAADIDHEMQIFYLERGKGTSNCRIEFNLPMKDEVVITKDATKSWSAAAEAEDLDNGVDPEIAGVDNLTEAEQAIVNNIDFGFTLYKKTADGEFAPVANTNFYLEGTGAATPPIRSTNEDGHFTLRNGQSARFVTEIPADGVTYYVVEDKVPDGFLSPDFNFAGEATYDYSYTDGEKSGTAPAADASQIPEQIIPMPTENEDGSLTWAENKSYEVTVKGSIESSDSIEFICSNFLNAELPNPTATTMEDIIVIDYGLPVDIDPLANDVVRGDSVEIIAFGGENLALGEIQDKDDDLIFEEEELDITTDDNNFHSGNVAFNDVTYRGAYNSKGEFIGDRDTFTYTLTEQLTEVEVIKYIIKVTGSDTQDATQEKLEQYDYAIGTIYIVPATIMYYEENFSDLITFRNNNNGTAWGGTIGTSDGECQEPGVVGTVGDSTYGSDAAYLKDSGDSDGTSRYCDTTNGALQFSYTFTGTGTSIFARTSASTGYVQFKLYEGTDTTGEYLNITYRDTYWKDENATDLDAGGTLYNIPIYTESDLEYGTYTVVATIAKAGTKTDGNINGSGKDFYLDGIRIMQPLNQYAEREDLTEKALDAYADDGEANLDVVTLREKLITDAENGVAVWDGTNFVVMTDIDGAIVTSEDYTSIGPKEEVYLLPGQKVSFSMKYWKNEGLNLYIGMKAPFGTGALKVGQTSYNLMNAADCYYDVTANRAALITEKEQGTTAEGYLLYEDANGQVYFLGDDGKYYDYDTEEAVDVDETSLTEHMVEYYVVTYTFEATDKIVSLTNIKVVGNYEFTILQNGGNGGDNEGGDVVIDGSEG